MLAHFHQVPFVNVIENMEGYTTVFSMLIFSFFLMLAMFLFPHVGYICYFRTQSLCPFDWLASTSFISFLSCVSIFYRLFSLA